LHGILAVEGIVDEFFSKHLETKASTSLRRAPGGCKESRGNQPVFDRVQRRSACPSSVRSKPPGTSSQEGGEAHSKPVHRGVEEVNSEKQGSAGTLGLAKGFLALAWLL